MNASVCRLEQLVDGHSRGFDPLREGHDTMFIVRRGDRLFAYRDACPHWEGTPLPWRKDAYLSGDGRRIVCSAHGAQFDIETGICTLGPCLGQSLTPVALVVDDAGNVHVEPNTLPERTS